MTFFDQLALSAGAHERGESKSYLSRFELIEIMKASGKKTDGANGTSGSKKLNIKYSYEFNF